MADDFAVERAVGMLMAQRGYSAADARQLLVDLADTQDGTIEKAAADLVLRSGRSDSSPVRLSQTYHEIGVAIEALPVESRLLRVTEMAVERSAEATWASITLYDRGQLATVAATHPSAQAADQIQYDLLEGPCVTAVISDSAYLDDRRRREGQWPNFAARAHKELGVQALLGLRLGLEIDSLDDTLASLNIYSDRSGSFSAEAIVMATLVAAHASTALIASQYQRHVGNLQRALETNRAIGVAIGILMNEHKITSDRAFSLLRIASQHSNRKLREVAEVVVRTGTVVRPAD